MNDQRHHLSFKKGVCLYLSLFISVFCMGGGKPFIEMVLSGPFTQKHQMLQNISTGGTNNAKQK